MVNKTAIAFGITALAGIGTAAYLKLSEPNLQDSVQPTSTPTYSVQNKPKYDLQKFKSELLQDVGKQVRSEFKNQMDNVKTEYQKPEEALEQGVKGFFGSIQRQVCQPELRQVKRDVDRTLSRYLKNDSASVYQDAARNLPKYSTQQLRGLQARINSQLEKKLGGKYGEQKYQSLRRQISSLKKGKQTDLVSNVLRNFSNEQIVDVLKKKRPEFWFKRMEQAYNIEIGGN